MKQFKPFITRLMVITALLLPWATTEALDTFKESGAISKYNRDKFTMNNRVFRVSPDAQFPSASRSGYATFKAGDMVYIEGKILSGVRYVDVMVYFPADPS